VTGRLSVWTIIPAPEYRPERAKDLSEKSNQRDWLIAGDAALMGGKGTDRRQCGRVQ
jgi:hypothetical protein